MKKSNLINLSIISLVLIADQYTKYWASKTLASGLVLTIIPGFIELVFKKNTGIAFSMFDGYPQILSWLISAIMVFLLYQILYSGKVNLGLACIIGGGIGNLLDRFTRGYVVDFINPIFVNFAVFNIADVFLNIGVALIIIEQIFFQAKGQRQ